MVRETKIAKAKGLCHSILGENHLTFEGGGLEDLEKKFPAAAQGRKKKSCMVSSEEKNIMHGLCAKKKILQIIDIFQWVGWLLQIPARSVANLSAVFTSKLCSFI